MTVPPISLEQSRQRIRQLNARYGRLVAATYDISQVCNLKCEGCLHFDIPEAARRQDSRSPQEWEAFFASEAQRGVTMALLAGAEPAFKIERIRAAQRYIRYGVIFTNGTLKLPDDIRYRIHISTWGVGEIDVTLRATDSLPKAMENYRRDPRAVAVFTISALNIDHIVPSAAAAHRCALPLTFNYFSPPLGYANRLVEGQANGADHFRISSPVKNLILDRASFARARQELSKAKQRYPETVRYSLYYDDWVTQDTPYDIDPQTRLARDCGLLKLGLRHHAVDLQNGGRCCCPQLDCASCRAYALASMTFFTRRPRVAGSSADLARWVEAREVWCSLFLPASQEDYMRSETAHA